MNADKQGRFGFNIRGGSDLGLPIVVSRVVPNTSAYRSQPKLCQGDQVCIIFVYTSIVFIIHINDIINYYDKKNIGFNDKRTRSY